MSPESLWFLFICELKLWLVLRDRQVDRLAGTPDLLVMGHLFLSSQFQNILTSIMGLIFIIHLVGDLRGLFLTNLLQMMLLSFQDKEGSWGVFEPEQPTGSL